VDAALAVADVAAVVARITLARSLQEPREACVKLLEEMFSIVGRRLLQIKYELLWRRLPNTLELRVAKTSAKSCRTKPL
jgi:hypothetical protein